MFLWSFCYKLCKMSTTSIDIRLTELLAIQTWLRQDLKSAFNRENIENLVKVEE